MKRVKLRFAEDLKVEFTDRDQGVKCRVHAETVVEIASGLGGKEVGVYLARRIT